MPTRSYNRFTPWVQQDDYLTNWPWFIEHKNVDGLRDGYALHLWPKVNKGIITNDAISSITFEFPSDPIDLTESIIGGKGWEIYRLDSTDNTPAYTFSAAWAEIKAIVTVFPYYYIFYQATSWNGKIARVNVSDVATGTFASMNEGYVADAGSSFKSVPYVVVGTNIYYGISGKIGVFDWTATVTSFWFPDTWVTGLTLRGTTMMVYTRSGNVYQWDIALLTYSALRNIGTYIYRVAKGAIYDYIYCADGQVFIGQWLSVQPLSYPKISNRMNSNVSYDKRLNFSLSDENTQNKVWITALQDMYLACNDTIPGIYKYGKLNPQMANGFHKIVTQNHLGTQIDVIYDMYFHQRGSQFLYFSYKAGATYWVDYIDLWSLETTTDGYAITEVFAWDAASFEKTIESIFKSTSNTSWNNYIKLYYRVNNGSWLLIKNINDSVASIVRDEINKEDGWVGFEKNIDVQFKIELHNDTGWQDSPSLHELIYNYTLV